MTLAESSVGVRHRPRAISSLMSTISSVQPEKAAPKAMSDTPNIIAENIARRRKELGLTQRELAEKLNISDKTLL